MARPELARPAPGARETLARLVQRYRVVAIVSGRRSEEVARLLEVPGMRYFGVYGMEDAAPDIIAAIEPRVRQAAEAVPGAWVEDKGASLAVHYRQSPDPARARASLVSSMQEVASSAGLEVVEGKMVVELLLEGRPRKGGAVERLVGENGLSGALYAGDDVADVDAFATIDRLEATGVLGVKVAVRGDETPAELLEGADVIVEGPEGLVALLDQLA